MGVCTTRTSVYNINVNNLFLNNGKQWDEQKIKQMFTHDAIKEILDVLLLEDVGNYCLVWKEERNGDYSIKTYYKLLMQFQSEQGCRSIKGDCSSLCEIRAPPKSKHLLWRICRDSLLTRFQLHHHYFQYPSICQLCEGGVVDEWCVFFGCTTSL